MFKTRRLRWCEWLFFKLYWYLTSQQSCCPYYCLPFRLHLSWGLFFMKHWVIQNNTSKWNQILLLSCFWNRPKHHEKDQGCEIIFPSVAEPAENIPYSGFFFVFTFLNSQHCQAKINCVMQKHKWKLNCCRCRTIPLSSCYLIFPHSRLKNE